MHFVIFLNVLIFINSFNEKTVEKIVKITILSIQTVLFYFKHHQLEFIVTGIHQNSYKQLQSLFDQNTICFDPESYSDNCNQSNKESNIKSYENQCVKFKHFYDNLKMIKIY